MTSVLVQPLSRPLNTIHSIDPLRVVLLHPNLQACNSTPLLLFLLISPADPTFGVEEAEISLERLDSKLKAKAFFTGDKGGGSL